MSSEAKHTPGPWKWIKARTVLHLTAPGSARNGLLVSTPMPKSKADHNPEDDANQRLIEAAPDLLAACDSALFAVRLERQVNPSFRKAWDQIEAKLAAAITLATKEGA